MNHQTGTGKYEQMLVTCKNMKPIPTAVVHPCEESALSGAIEAANLGIIVPILVGPRDKIVAIAKSAGIDLTGVEIVDTPHSNASAAKGVELVREAKAELLMKGSLHTDELIAAVVSREGGLRTGRRISHVFVMDVPTYHKVLMITDGAINIAPTLEDKVDICQNAIDLAISLGLDKPKVAILAAVETVNSKNAGHHRCCSVVQNGRAGAESLGGILDGPLALDNAIQQGRLRQPKGFTPKLLAIPTSRSPGSGSRSRKHACQTTDLPDERRRCGIGAGRRKGPDHPHQPRR